MKANLKRFPSQQSSLVVQKSRLEFCAQSRNNLVSKTFLQFSAHYCVCELCNSVFDNLEREELFRHEGISICAQVLLMHYKRSTWGHSFWLFVVKMMVHLKRNTFVSDMIPSNYLNCGRNVSLLCTNNIHLVKMELMSINLFTWSPVWCAHLLRSSWHHLVT